MICLSPEQRSHLEFCRRLLFPQKQFPNFIVLTSFLLCRKMKIIRPQVQKGRKRNLNKSQGKAKVRVCVRSRLSPSSNRFQTLILNRSRGSACSLLIQRQITHGGTFLSLLAVASACPGIRECRAVTLLTCRPLA